MKKQADRRAIVVSAVLTLLILMGSGGVLFANRLAAANGGAPAASAQRTDSLEPAVVLTSNSAAATTPDSEALAAYQAQLQNAYQALNDAYAQIETLQAARQPASVSPFGQREHDESWEHGSGVAQFTREHNDD